MPTGARATKEAGVAGTLAREAETAAAQTAAHAARETEAATAGCVGPQKPKMRGKGIFAAEAPAAAKVVEDVAAEAPAAAKAEEKILPAVKATVAAEAPKAAPKAGGMGEAAEAIDKRAIGLAGNELGRLLQEKFGGQERFEVTSKSGYGTREFDGAYGNIWYEAKTGGLWKRVLSSESEMSRFQSKMGKGLKIAQENGKNYVLYSKAPIPEPIKKWLIEKSIMFVEII